MSPLKASPPSRSSSPVGPPSNASLHHSPSRTSLKSLGGPSKLREQLVIAPARSTSPKISQIEAEREPEGPADGGGGFAGGGGGSGWSGTGAGASGWKSRGSEKAALASLLAADPKWKKFNLLVDKSLASFDAVKEWADFISFLSKLLKTLQLYPTFTEIPKKLIVAKRLAQCLTPALPSGVHQRALDVYTHILGVIGPEGLKRDLQIWSSGLFPFFQYAATSVKPTLLNIYESYYLPLQNALRPVMKALILALLPGLDEETGEFFDKVVFLLDFVSSTVSPPFFLQNLWLILISTPSARITALNYLSRRMPKLGEGEDIVPIVGPDIGLMIRAFASSLEDDNLLVQRGILDLLVTSLRLDGAASAKHAREVDRLILMRSASTVVLRRDLSLSRRLYTWLLGSDDNPDAQVAHLRSHGLDLLRKSLTDEMLQPPSMTSGEVSEPQRPYKIFISLLDKWEIGYPLTDVIVEDAFRALKLSLERGDDEDILMTGSMMYEVIDPYLAWRRLFHSLKTDLEAKEPSGDSISLIRWILKTFKNQDEEVRHLHLPIVFSALLELVETTASSNPSSPSLQPALTLAVEILLLMPTSVFTSSHHAKPRPLDPKSPEQALHHALAFYSLDIDLSRPAEPDYPAFSGPLLFQRSVEGALRICSEVAKRAKGQESSVVASLKVLKRLLKLGEKFEDAGVVVEWDSERWFDGFAGLLLRAKCFAVVEGIVQVALSLGNSSRIQPSLDLDTRPKMTLLTNGVLRYMTSTTLLYHIPAVQLLWSLQHATPSKHIDSILAQDLLSLSVPERLDSIYSFGVLWRHTEDLKASTEYLGSPIFAILDSLKDPNVTIRRAGETWLRTNLRSQLRVLEPILFVLLDPLILRIPTTTTYNARESRGFRYERPFDLARTHYMLETLAALNRFGGHSFNRLLKATPVSKLSERIIKRAENANVTHTDANCMDVLLETLLRFIQSEPSPQLASSLGSGNDHLQLNALDTVQTIISRGDISSIGLKSAESVVVAKLFSCIHEGRLDTQNQLLHVLHSIIIVSSAASAANRRKVSAARTSRGIGHVSRFSTSSTDTQGDEDAQASEPTSDNVSPLLMQTLMDGISSTTNRPVLQHWIDFILMTIPQFQGHLRPLLLPLCDCVIQQLQNLTHGLHVALKQPSSDQDLPLASSESVAIMFLSALERIVTLALGHFPARPEENERSGSVDQSGGLLGYVSNVFSMEEAPVPKPSDGLMPRSAGLKCFTDAVRVLQSLWTVSNSLSSASSSSSSEGLQFICSRSSSRAQQVLEHLYRLQPIDVVQTLAECWSNGDVSLEIVPQGSTSSFEILDLLAPNAQSVVSMMCSNWSKPDRSPSRGPSSEPILYSFTEIYFTRLEGPIAVQVWQTFITLAKDVVANNTTTVSKNQVFPTLRCLTALAEKVASTSALEDKRLRRDLQDAYTKLVDTSIALASRSYDATPLARRWAANGAGSRPGTPVATSFDEKSNGLEVYSPTLYTTITSYIARRVLPKLRPFLQDTDRVASICVTISQQIVAPALRSRTKSLDVEPLALQVLVEMTRIPGTIKAWRGLVGDSFNDSRFFNGSPSSGERWRPLIKAIMDGEKERMAELIIRAASPPSANIFTNRESEMLLRSLNIRRLSFVLFSAGMNHFLITLPSIQERLVEILRTTVVSPMVHSEVYLCLRVLVCRMAPRELSNLWPIILTELLRVFEQLMEEIPPDGSDVLQLILAACKFLDLLLVLQSEDFQIHQWMFVTDTVDAVHSSDEWQPESLMDRLAELISESSHHSKAHAVDSKKPPPPSPPVIVQLSGDPSSTLRRPLLSHLKRIESISELGPFFSQASMTSYESLYSSAAVDWDAVDAGLEREIFEGTDVV